MNLTEADQLLTVIQNVDKRIIDDAAVVIWQELLHDLDYDDCVTAVTKHFRENTDYLTPAHIVAGVRSIRDERRRGTSAPLQLPGQWVPDQERANRNARGAELCRQAAARAIAAAEARRDGKDDDPTRELALQRARREKRERARDKAINPEMSRLVSQATRHIQQLKEF